MKYLLTTLMLLFGSLAWAAPESVKADSLVILFGNKTRLVIHSDDKEGIRQLSGYDLNKIIRDMGMKLDSSRNGETYIVIDQNKVQRYLQDTVLVVTRKDGEVTVTIKESEGDRTDRSDDEDNSWSNRNRDRDRHRNRENWNFGLEAGGLGLNTLIEQSQVPNYPSEAYSLRPLGSRYVSLGIGQLPTVVRGRYVSLKLFYSLEVSWNNFMFDNDLIAQKGPNGILFADAGRELKKSKLTVCSVNIPFVPRVSFYNRSGRKIFHLGVGAYAGYRVDSYSKIKELDGDKDRRHSNFYLNDFRYGAVVHLGIVKTNFFVKYDLNPMFKEGKGPDVRALSFGIGL
ncbi:outer membrane beta-barrel protein [Larkinella soli]|uniref:outer membrane beta-barrel protein n=1 Tax=Larkinella soli TaxID=1770527 RepID=UPI001E3D0FC5|nr:outer membrane beta-barrel protein [Larkinella soli]